MKQPTKSKVGKINVGTIAPVVAKLVQPAVYSLAGRLFVLSSWRAGSKKWKPRVEKLFETGLVTSLYEQMLMCSALSQLDIRREMNEWSDPKCDIRADLWLRNLGGGLPLIIQAGDFAPTKVHDDLGKARKVNPDGHNWFLAFFRHDQAKAKVPWQTVEKSFKRKFEGLDSKQVAAAEKLCGTFEVYRPDGEHQSFGYALLKAKL